RYLALPASRVEDVLKQAFFSVTFEDPVADARFRPALRNVLVRRADGSEVPVDMVAYYTGGERDANPYVMDGDVVYVPAFRPAISGVFVSGEVPFAGVYDYRDGDTVLDLLRLAAGPSGLEALGSVRLARTGEADQNLRIADLLRAESKGEAGVPVRALDNLHVPEPEARPATATAAGFVRYPGVYPIEAGQTTLAEFIARAGGFREDALVRGAYLERGATIEERRAVDFMQQPNIGRLPFLVDTSAVLQQTRLGDLDVLGRLYLARALSSENRVSVDVASALGGGGEPVVLYGGDRLVVPRDEQSVRVIGEVEQPGAVPFQASLNAEGYISRAGGRGGKSADVFVIKAGTGQLVEAKRATVESGDIVFVNRAGGDPINTDEQRLALQQLDRRNRNFQLVLQTIGVAASIGTTVAVIFNVFGRE
ncbi:MAG: SLBB domain-containing protein, partial [Bacteroidota bacterium]